ncbi:MAG TPA: RDD family protein [Vicinamibacteria bacterium]|jgi:uncharacterized RDD family membrane protein YckC
MDDNVSSEATVLGLDNIPLELPIAGAGSRALSAALDYLIVGILVLLWGGGCLALGVMASLGWWALAAFLVGFFVIEYGYFAGLEIAREGQTLGKWALGLRVVTRDGARPGTAALLLRNAVRSVDLIVGVPLMATDTLARRLGDRLAGTLVVHTHSPARETVVRRTPRGWDAQDAALLEMFLRRARDMEGWRAERLAGQLLDTIQADDADLALRIDRALGPVEALRQLVEGTEA